MLTEYYAATIGVNATVFLALALDDSAVTFLRDQILRTIAAMSAFLGILLALPALLPVSNAGGDVCVNDDYTSPTNVSLTGATAVVGLVALLSMWLLRDVPTGTANPSQVSPRLAHISVGVLAIVTLLVAIFMIWLQANGPRCYLWPWEL